jgi:hypothetical protein
MKGITASLGAVPMPPRQSEPDTAQLEDVIATLQQQTRKAPMKPQPKAAGTTRGKSSNPDYEPVKVLVRSEYRIKASRKWEDEHGRNKDFSDLIEHLLTKYIGA